MWGGPLVRVLVRAGPLDPLLANEINLLHPEQAGEGVGCLPGVRPTINADCPAEGKLEWHWAGGAALHWDLAAHTEIFDETALVAQARQGDPAAFTQLVERYERKIFRLAQHITQNREDAEDVLQETFLKAFQHLGGFEGNSKFYTWLVRIAVNESLMKLRKRKWDKTLWLDEPVETGDDVVAREIAVWDDNPEQRYSQEELQDILNKSVQSLTPIYRSVFVLRDIEELSIEETAQALDLSVPAVKSRLLRARLQLRDKLTGFFKKKVEDPFAYL